MPLTRYEIRSEYSLANPDLYRVADKDDPEGLLEGVAMAGLVGIIRQLGDLAEFAAEVFHDLHEDVLATAARGHELVVRVRQLEREVPLIEKMMFSKTDPQIFMYNPGVEWHVHIHDEQNHFTQGDLPRFVRSAYEECRSPPRLFVLDRFDVIGAGACLKRFTDPSFFKMQWASSELMKAEKEQREHRARRLKKKGRKQVIGEMGEARPASRLKLSVPTEAENEARSSISSSFSDSSGVYEQEALNLLKQENEDMVTASSSLFSGRDMSQLNGGYVEDGRVEELTPDPSSSKQELSTMNMGKGVVLLDEGLENNLKELEVMGDDSASEADNFVDAVTTMDSEVETDPEMKGSVEVDADLLVSVTENEAMVQQPMPENPRRAGGEQILPEEAVEHSLKKEAVERGEACPSDVVPEELEGADKGCSVDHALAVSLDEEDVLSANGHVTFPSQTVDTLTPDGPNAVSSVNIKRHPIAEFTELSADNGSTPGRLSDASLSSIDIHAVAKSTELPVDNLSVVSAEEESFLSLDKSINTHYSENSHVSTSVNWSGVPSPVLDGKVLASSDMDIQSENNGHVLTISETKDANNRDEFLEDRASSHVSEADESAALGSQSQSPKILGPVSTRKRWQLNKPYDKVILAPDLETDGSETSESEKEESPKKLSLNSSPNSSIQPMRWAIDYSKSYHSDNEIDDLQGSLGSLSSSSSALSSPRPSTLTTTLQSLNLEGRSQSPPLSLEPAGPPPPPPPPPPPGSSLNSGINTVRVPLLKTSVESVVSPALEHSAQSSPRSPSSPVQPFFDSLPSLGLNLNASPENIIEQLSTENIETNNLENFPPPPPLPPLAWRTTRRSHSAAVFPSESLESNGPITADVELIADEPPQVLASSTTVCAVLHNTGARHGPSDSMQSFIHETFLPEIKALHKYSEEISKALKPAESECRNASASTLNAGTSQEESVQVLLPLSFEKNRGSEESPNNSSQEKVLDGNSNTMFTQVLQIENIPARLDDSRLKSDMKGARGYGVQPTATQDSSASLKIDEFSGEASTSSAINRLKRRSKWALTSSTASSDDREVLLEQIRTKSFSLRSSSAEKLVAPRPVNNINVAAILQKANAIRQAFAGSDDDDEWSDT